MKVQEKPVMLIFFQGILMLGIIAAPAISGFRFLFPKEIFDWIGTVAITAGTLIVILSVRTLRKTFTVHAAIKNGTKLATTFPFNYSRNPMYVGGLIQCFSWSLLQRSIPSFLLSVLLWILLNAKVKIEERNLEAVFGEERYLKMLWTSGQTATAS